VTFTYQLEREEDGRFLAEILELPGCLAYGATGEDALLAVQVLALRIVADRIEHAEHRTTVPNISFVQAA
jgi:predicted RNase H-like HicB family nuclease